MIYAMTYPTEPTIAYLYNFHYHPNFPPARNINAALAKIGPPVELIFAALANYQREDFEEALLDCDFKLVGEKVNGNTGNLIRLYLKKV